jgi:hypothetical protein
MRLREQDAHGCLELRSADLPHLPPPSRLPA